MNDTPQLTIDQMRALAVDALEDVKAKDILVMDTSKLSPLFECMIVASGDSNRQVKALANNVREKLKEAGAHVVGMEGEMYGEWVLVDFGNLVVHVMLPPVRDYYNLEQLWGGQKPVSAPGPRPWQA
ncbi:ribosome silencing factor [Parachitinimonas caeni]|uniref:Ribosomal silencing factor RsfS n=1 Tax=Parachitinimonas caeni TaxID=3031301 RepID=A0ABT7DRI1_9NEIS|nr:ribosome silencing factor [Parachitinimonas caeni]MDK2122675.1 ribosome silencing factor [Parachitinimonas caeni]